MTVFASHVQVLLTGQRGYIGHALCLNAPSQVQLSFLPGRLEELVPRSLEADLVIHAAGALRHRQDCWESNVTGTERLLRALKKPCPLVLCSSKAVYAPTESDILDESSAVGARDVYGRSKQAAELVLQNSDCPHLILRLGTAVGWNGKQAGKSFISQAAALWAAGEQVTRYTPDALRDDFYVQDMARFIWAASLQSFERGSWNQSYNVSGPRHSLHDLLNQLREQAQALGLAAQLKDIPGVAARTPLLSHQALQENFELPAYSCRTEWLSSLLLMLR